MAIPLNINGAVFEYPENFDENWGINATGWAQAVTNGMLQRAGGNFPLTADANFGASFGLVSLYYKSRSSNIATAGTVRLASADPGIVFRNNANSGNLVLTTDASDNLLFNGSTFGTGGNVSAGTAHQLAYYPASTNSVSGLTLITANRALASDANGLPVASAATAASLAFLDATSSVQTQLNSKAPTASPTFTGTVTIPNGTTSATAAAVGQVQYAFQNAVQVTSQSSTSIVSITFADVILTGTIVPTSASSRIKITVFASFTMVNTDVDITILRNNTNLALGGAGFLELVVGSTGQLVPIALTYIDSPATTSSTDYKLTGRFNAGAGTCVANSHLRTMVMLLEELR